MSAAKVDVPAMIRELMDACADLDKGSIARLTVAGLMEKVHNLLRARKRYNRPGVSLAAAGFPAGLDELEAAFDRIAGVL